MVIENVALLLSQLARVKEASDYPTDRSLRLYLKKMLPTF
jgi:hypothetical protein